MSEPLTLMAVHAHPDDEASSGGILAAYADQGIRTVVVTCTNGEYGDAPGGIKPGQPGHDPDAVARQRLAELDQSVKILKVSDLEKLGYHDSGMEEWDYKSRPEAFSNVPIATVAGRIADLITKYRPQVLVTYDDQGAYQHPDHVHASLAAQAAAKETGIPAKVYLSTMKTSNWGKIFAALRAAGEEVPDWQEDEERGRHERLAALGERVGIGAVQFRDGGGYAIVGHQAVMPRFVAPRTGRSPGPGCRSCRPPG